VWPIFFAVLSVDRRGEICFRIFTEFDELNGDRAIANGSSIMAGLARLDGIPVMVIGHEKGRKTQEKIEPKRKVHQFLAICQK